MAEKKSKLVVIKTKPTTDNVMDFINKITDEQKRNDCLQLIDIMQKATNQQPVLWSNSIIGFGNKRYKSPTTGREVDWLLIGFAPRKANLSLHVTMNVKAQETLLKKLGKHKTGVGCLYINTLKDVDIKVLKTIIETALQKNK